MATITHAGTGVFTTTAGNKTVPAASGFAVAVGDLIVVIAPATGVATSVVTDNNPDGLGAYVKIGSSFTGFSTAGDLSVWVRTALIGSATNTTWTITQTASTGGGADIFRVSGMTLVGAAAVRSSGGQSTGTLGTTPAPVLSKTPVTQNPIITAVCNGTSPGGVTGPATYTAPTNLGYTVPTTGLDTAFINSGITSATVTWGSTSATAFASIAIELDTLGPPGPPILTASQPCGVRVIRVRKGSALSTTLISQVAVPPPPVQAGPPFFPKQAIRAKYLRFPIAGGITAEFAKATGSVSGPLNGAGFGNAVGCNGAPVQNPQAGPVFYPANQAIRARIPREATVGCVTGRGVGGAICGAINGSGFGSAKGSAGAPVQNPGPGPVFVQRVTPARVTPPPPHPRAGRIGSSFGGPVENPQHGPPVYPLHSPVRARQPLPRRGVCRSVSSVTITIVIPASSSGPTFIPADSPIRAKILQNAPRGRIYR